MKKNINLAVIISLILLLDIFLISCGTGSGARKKRMEESRDLMNELKYGRLLAKEIMTAYPVLEDKNAAGYVSKVGKSVALFAGRPDIEYYFAILNTMEINAYATPGGYVFITRGAIMNMKNEAELAGVLAHEIAHINNRQIMKLLPPPKESKGFTGLLASFLLSQGTVVSSAFGKVVEEARDLLFVKGYRIEDEYLSDMHAVLYVSETGYYLNGLADFLARIDKNQKNDSAKVYNTHPPMSDRIVRIRKFINDEGLAQNSAKAESRFLENLKHIINTGR